MSFFLNIASAFSVEKRAIKKMVKQEKRNEVIKKIVALRKVEKEGVKSSLGKVGVPINSTKVEETTSWANPLNPLSPFSPIGPLSPIEPLLLGEASSKLNNSSSLFKALE